MLEIRLIEIDTHELIIDDLELELNNELRAMVENGRRLLHVRPIRFGSTNCLFVLHQEDYRR